jgi:hypothetical protein
MAPAPSKPKFNEENNERHQDEEEDDEFDHVADEGLRALLYLLRVQGLFAQLFYRFHELERQQSNNVIPSAAPSVANAIPAPAATVAPVDQIPTVSGPPAGSPAAERIRLRSHEVEMKWNLARKE